MKSNVFNGKEKRTLVKSISSNLKEFSCFLSLLSSVLRFHLDLTDGKLWIRTSFYSSFLFVVLSTKPKEERKEQRCHAKESSKLIMERWTHLEKHKCGKKAVEMMIMCTTELSQFTSHRERKQTVHWIAMCRAAAAAVFVLLLCLWSRSLPFLLFNY